MELIHRRIPQEFLERLPEGMKFIHRHGSEFLVVEEIFCPKGHSLMADSVRIHGEPSIRLAVDLPGSREGLIFVDSFWGSHAKLYSFQQQTQGVVHAHCPDCTTSLMVDRVCSDEGCDSRQGIALHLPGSGNVVTVCARLGCPDHELVVGGLASDALHAVSEINFFGHGDEEMMGGI